jgi:hypothetical protein
MYVCNVYIILIDLYLTHIIKYKIIQMYVKIVIFKTLKPVYNGQLFWSSDCPLYPGFTVL